MAGAAVVAALAAVAVSVLFGPRGEPVLEQRTRDQLELREGVLFIPGEVQPFDGSMVDYYAGGAPKIEVSIRGGRAHGRSRGWFENGQLEVDEMFVEGVSHGARRRWHANGKPRSVAEVERGQVAGRFTEWHDNGQEAVVMTLVDGEPDGEVVAFYRSGALRSKVTFERGEEVARQSWDDGLAGQN